MINAKILRRAAVIAQNALNSLLQPIISVALSFLIIRLASEALWGGFVAVLVVVQFTAHIAGWGNREHLLREFSRQPYQLTALWQRSLTTRLALFLLLVPLLLLASAPLIGMIVWGVALVVAQSYDVMLVYRKAFWVGIVIEMVGTAVLAAFILSRPAPLTVNDLLLGFTTVQWGKAAALTLIFRRLWQGFIPRLDVDLLRQGAPFFLLGFSGLLATRIDLYTVSLLLSEQDVGRYQVFINLLIYVQATANFILLPFAKSLYRLDAVTTRRIARRLFMLGLLLIPPALLLMDGLLIGLYDLRYDAAFFLLGGLFALPIYAYLPLIYQLYKLERTGVVLRVNLFGAGMNLVLNLLLLPLMGLSGALLASAVMQWGMLALYLFDMREKSLNALPNLPGDIDSITH
ncbi:MAG: hypothetical protein OHK0046_20140 [Anaerolineae bacterium]